MIVCHCKAVRDRDIREAVKRGAESPREVVLACNAGRTCGGCMPAVRQIIDEERAGLPPCELLPAAAAS